MSPNFAPTCLYNVWENAPVEKQIDENKLCLVQKNIWLPALLSVQS
jgi:hypothetical protein